LGGFLDPICGDKRKSCTDSRRNRINNGLRISELPEKRLKKSRRRRVGRNFGQKNGRGRQRFAYGNGSSRFVQETPIHSIPMTNPADG